MNTNAPLALTDLIAINPTPAGQAIMREAGINQIDFSSNKDLHLIVMNVQEAILLFRTVNTWNFAGLFKDDQVCRVSLSEEGVKFCDVFTANDIFDLANTGVSSCSDCNDANDDEVEYLGTTNDIVRTLVNNLNDGTLSPAQYTKLFIELGLEDYEISLEEIPELPIDTEASMLAENGASNGIAEHDLSGELERQYEWPVFTPAGPNAGTIKVIIEQPVSLFVKEGSAYHRVLDSDGRVHCVPAPGHFGCHLSWVPRSQDKPVSF